MGPGWSQWVEISWDIRPPKRPTVSYAEFAEFQTNLGELL